MAKGYDIIWVDERRMLSRPIKSYRTKQSVTIVIVNDVKTNLINP